MGTAMPLYKSIYESLEDQILSGQLLPGQTLPSVRELARQYSVNPNTIERTVRDLQRNRLITIRRGQGISVTDDAHALSELKKRKVRSTMQRYLTDMKKLGYTERDAVELLQKWRAAET